MKKNTLTSAAALLLALTAGACSDEPLAPEPFAPVPCARAQNIPDALLTHVTAGGLSIALQDARARLLPSLPEGSNVARLQEALDALAGHTGAGRPDAACRSIALARSLLARQPDDAGSLPTRAALAVLLDLTESWLSVSR